MSDHRLRAQAEKRKQRLRHQYSNAGALVGRSSNLVSRTSIDLTKTQQVAKQCNDREKELPAKQEISFGKSQVEKHGGE
ncbi:unnamed protein product [Protopolystoma xenopodis]|uniref:IBB domain-containing protein n=1 Tax=Protopolystoma xenopodis TaxID=117903 RepID=A0A3S5CS20_9PLAT|nr:unnamed protein product [Protopolystoma xenopodis]